MGSVGDDESCAFTDQYCLEVNGPPTGRYCTDMANDYNTPRGNTTQGESNIEDMFVPIQDTYDPKFEAGEGATSVISSIKHDERN